MHTYTLRCTKYVFFASLRRPPLSVLDQLKWDPSLRSRCTPHTYWCSLISCQRDGLQGASLGLIARPPETISARCSESCSDRKRYLGGREAAPWACDALARLSMTSPRSSHESPVFWRRTVQQYRGTPQDAHMCELSGSCIEKGDANTLTSLRCRNSVYEDWANPQYKGRVSLHDST